MEHLDIIIYALIAAILLVRLWGVFGRRNEEDRPRPNPFTTPPQARDDEDVVVQRGRGSDPQPLLTVAPLSLLGALETVRQADPSFDEKAFLQKARTMFTAIIEAFARGDLSGVKPMLGPAVLPHFEAAMAARVARNETLSCRVERIREAETTAARTDEGGVSVTVRFISEQENILRDGTGKIISGAAGRLEEITDLWTFARDTKTPGADWQLAETKS